MTHLSDEQRLGEVVREWESGLLTDRTPKLEIAVSTLLGIAERKIAEVRVQREALWAMADVAKQILTYAQKHHLRGDAAVVSDELLGKLRSARAAAVAVSGEETPSK